MKQPGEGGSPVSQLSMNLVFQTGISVVTKGVPGGGVLCVPVLPQFFLICSLFNASVFSLPLPFCSLIYCYLLLQGHCPAKGMLLKL